MSPSVGIHLGSKRDRYMTEPIRTTPELIALIGAVTDSATAHWFRDLLSR